MDEALGCSKCRYSQKGCARCRDPAFRERQLTKAPVRRKLNGPGKGSKRGKKRPAEMSKEERDLLERPEGSKRTRFTRKARKTGGHARNSPAGTRQQTVGPQLGQSTHTAAEEPANSMHAEDEQVMLDDPQGPSASQAAPEAPEAAQQNPEASELRTNSQGTAAMADVEKAGGTAKQIASGLELGLMAGLLPLQQGSEGAEPARKALEEAALVSKEPAETPASGADSKIAKSVEGEHKAVQSTSEQSRDVSQTSAGVSSLDTMQRAQRIEDSKERQRQFMEQLQRKVQDNKQQTEASSKPCLAAILASASRKKKKDQKQIVGDPRTSMWEPPQSPFGLIEEQLFGNPWKLLIACILLNKTNVTQVRKVIWKLFELMPTPEVGMHADEDAVRELIQPLGLAPKRAPMLIRFCRDYVEKQWVDPKELHGVGQYAADAYNIFCRGDWRLVSPTDKDLLKYHQWLTETDGEGSGLLRETEPQPEPS